MPERAASMENPREEGVLNLGGSTRVKGEAVRRRLRMPMRLRVGERPAGAERGVGLGEREVLSFGTGERAFSIGRRGDVRVAGLRALEKSLGDGGALVRKQLTGFAAVSLLDPSVFLDFLDENNMMGSTFSESSSKVIALRLEGVERVDNAVEDVRFIV